MSTSTVGAAFGRPNTQGEPFSGRADPAPTVDEYADGVVKPVDEYADGVVKPAESLNRWMSTLAELLDRRCGEGGLKKEAAAQA